MQPSSTLSLDEFAEGLLRAILRVYPKASVDYMMNEPNPFLNPSGNTIKEAVKVLSEWVLSPDLKQLNTKPLERLMRLLALEKSALESFWGYLLKVGEDLSLRTDWESGMSQRYHAVLCSMNELKEEARGDILAIRYKEMTRQSGGIRKSREK